MEQRHVSTHCWIFEIMVRIAQAYSYAEMKSKSSRKMRKLFVLKNFSLYIWLTLVVCV